MPTIAPLSAERHAAKRWLRPSNFSFAKGEAAFPLVITEAPTAVMSLPLGFILQNDAYVLSALLGLESGKNLFVTHDGRWIGRYIPAGLRAYPFMAMRSEDQRLVLCVDEDSGLITDGPAGETLFDEEGKPTPALQQQTEFLTQLEQGRISTVTACAALQKHNCLRSWTITVKGGEGNERKIEGVFQVDEDAINALSDEAFLELRRAGALLVAYCQLLSMQHLPALGQLAESHAKVPPPVPVKGKDLDLSFMSGGDLFKFGGM